MKKETDSKKKKKKTKKSEQENSVNEERLEEEIIEAEKEIRNEEPEETFFDEPITRLPIQERTNAPVLERLIQRQEQIIPEEFINQQEQRNDREERRIDYSPTSNQPNYGFQRNTNDEEKKYESTFVPPVLSRREIQGDGMRQEFLRPQTETWQNRTSEQQLENIDIIEQETKIPFEEQRKYKRHRLK